MKDTACGENCPFVKQGFCAKDCECPHYVESWWIENQTNEPVLIRDCSPKRMLLQQQVLQARLEIVQASLEEARNQYLELSTHFKSALLACQSVINHQLTHNQEKKYEEITLCNDANGNS